MFANEKQLAKIRKKKNFDQFFTRIPINFDEISDSFRILLLITILSLIQDDNDARIKLMHD